MLDVPTADNSSLSLSVTAGITCRLLSSPAVQVLNHNAAISIRNIAPVHSANVPFDCGGESGWYCIWKWRRRFGSGRCAGPAGGGRDGCEWHWWRRPVSLFLTVSPNDPAATFVDTLTTQEAKLPRRSYNGAKVPYVRKTTTREGQLRVSSCYFLSCGRQSDLSSTRRHTCKLANSSLSFGFMPKRQSVANISLRSLS